MMAALLETEKLISYTAPSPLSSVRAILGPGSSTSSMHVFAAAVSTAIQWAGGSRASILTVIELPRTVVGRLWLISRALAMTLLGTTATSLFIVAMWVDRQLTWMTRPSMPPSTHKRSPAL